MNLASTDIDARFELTEAKEAEVDEDTGKVSVELRCGPFKFHHDTPIYPIKWKVTLCILYTHTHTHIHRER